jgi:hypothetical protein
MVGQQAGPLSGPLTTLTAPRSDDTALARDAADARTPCLYLQAGRGRADAPVLQNNPSFTSCLSNH